jgi:hypothetical protein
MEPTPAERTELARRAAHERITRFGGNRKAAYTEAKVNSNTWTRLENGDPLAERSRVAIVRMLWPETGGDWTKIEPPLTDSRLTSDELDEIRAAPISDATKQWVADMYERLQATEEGDGNGDDAAPIAT